MAATEKKSTPKTSTKKKDALIDPLYQKYTKSVIRALGSTEFYEFFMDAISRAENQFQFSNRKMEKTVNTDWVDAIEDSLSAFQNIVSNPRNVIKEDELIVNVANAKKAGADVVRHLAQHAELVERFDDEAGEVRPSRLMQKYREDTVGLYENRLVFTVLEMSYEFVKIRHDALFSAMSDEYGAKLKIDSRMETATELVHMDMFLHIKETDSALETDEKNAEIFSRISKMYRILGVLMNSQFAQQMMKMPRVKGNITKTNVLKKNPSYRKIVALMEFLKGYDDIGYTIRVIEQSPRINEIFERDIYHNIMFNYLILKGYLEDESDRIAPVAPKTKKRSLKPKFIKEIIEELTEDYDLPDVEVRKVLIEELTKEQLMMEEEAERLRLVEEQEQRKKEEEERLRLEREAEEERKRQEEEAEAERQRLEREAEERRIRAEKAAQDAEDNRRCKLFAEEIAYFKEHLQEQLDAREEALIRQQQAKKELEEALKIKEEMQQLQKDADEREKKRLQEEKEQRRFEKKQAEEQARLEQEQKDTEATQIYQDEIERFKKELSGRKALRKNELKRLEDEKREREEERQRRREAARY